MKIAVTGAFSYSGKYITGRLLERGEQVITLTGHPNRPDPFNGQVKAYPLDFDEANMTKSLQGVDVLVNTYWVRFDKGENTQPRAVENTLIPVNAANAAGVKRVVHISIANPSADSQLPYYWGKAANEKAVTESGMAYAILRLTVLVGAEDMLTLFMGGEAAATDDLSPLMIALKREGGHLEEVMFLTTQLFEEAKHVEYSTA